MSMIRGEENRLWPTCVRRFKYRASTMPKSDVSKSAISPRRSEDFPEWYQQVIRAADMAESSDVRGCMVIKPWGFGIWENMQRSLDAMFKATGHTNAYFPLFIPLSYMQKEAEHVEGFAKECAVVTHHRLELNAEGKMVPASPLTEPFVVRPTSETIIGASYAKWVQSYRDLPILINQWANVVRWEMRPRLFLRTTEFLWQEGHTVHETEAEARAETQQMLDVYATFARDYLAVPVFTGEKSESERFPGAVQTLCIEAMVQDRKAIQAGTSHFLGQNFSRSSGIQFQTRDGKQEFGWTTSWGVSTRMVGTVIMMHADDDGLILPPRVAPTHIVIIPVTPKPETRDAVLAAANELAAQLRSVSWHGGAVQVYVDQRDLGGGVKNWEWIKKVCLCGLNSDRAISKAETLPSVDVMAFLLEPEALTPAKHPPNHSSQAQNSLGKLLSCSTRSSKAFSTVPSPFAMQTPAESTPRKIFTNSSLQRIPRNQRFTADSPCLIGMVRGRWKNKSKRI